MMSGVGFFASLLSLMFYIIFPISALFLIVWIYRIKQNSDLQVEQNKQIIELLKNKNNPLS